VASCIGKNSYDFAKQMGWTEKFVDQLHREHLAVIKEGKGKVTEYTGILADGKEYTFLSHKYPLIVNGKTVGLVGVSVDITDRKNLEQHLKEAKEQAEIANKLKSQFIANMEHDIRTPCSGIAEMTKMLATEEKDQKKCARLNSVAAASKQLLDLLNNILAFDHVEFGRIPVLHKKFNIRDLINDILKLEEPVTHLKNLHLLAVFSDEIPKQLIGDEHRLRRILINLVSNAIKFTEKGYVSLTVKLLRTIDNKMCLLKISVKDTGRGISQEEQNLIYEKFSRGTPANEGIHKGMGLGLYIVKQFIEDIDGEIEVQSRPGFGSTFTCIIPFHIPLACRSIEPLESEERTKNRDVRVTTADKSLKVLLVEDDNLAQMVVGDMLKDKFRVKLDTVSTGNQALKLVASKKFDLIFMDVGLPDMDGRTVTKQIRESKNKNVSTPIVALTAHNSIETGKQAIAAGMNDFLVKPLSSDKTQKILDKLVYKKVKVSGEATQHASVKRRFSKKKIIDLSAATKILGKQETAKKVLNMLIEMLPKHQREIDCAFQEKDYNALADAAHKLIGSACYCGTSRLSKASEDLRIAAINKDTKVLKRLMNKIHNEINAVIKAYRKMFCS
jgi:two-component system aerobic respiration control sensor histidine kinase ArcB